jgi:polyhydroxyalkanoate synthase
MGGLLAVALAERRPRDVTALALLATPWDFHAAGKEIAERIAAVYRLWAAALHAWGELPVDGLQALFASLDPLLAMRKFRRFATFDPASEQACAFVALEDWLNDGVPLAAPVAAECLAGWYGRNEPATGRWRIAGEAIEPGRLRLPVLALIPERDRIVPPSAAVALACAIPGAASLTPPLGHIGMIVGGSAAAAVWWPLAQWLVEHG